MRRTDIIGNQDQILNSFSREARRDPDDCFIARLKARQQKRMLSANITPQKDLKRFSPAFLTEQRYIRPDVETVTRRVRKKI